MNSSGDGGGGRRQRAGETPEARRRRGEAEFLPSFAALQEAVGGACARHSEWQAKIAAGILAALEFAAADPAAAHALTIDARRHGSRAGDRQQELLDHFVAQIVAIAPADGRFSASTNEGIVESVAIMVRSHLLAGTERELPGLGAELVNLSLLPYCGMEEAQLWADRFAHPEA